MAMESSLLQGLSSMVAGERQKSCEKLVQILENGEVNCTHTTHQLILKFSDHKAISDDVMKRAVFLVADSNVLIAVKAMDCIEACSNQSRFQSLPLHIRNNALDSLINRLADGKVYMK